MFGDYKTYTSFSAPDLLAIKEFYTVKLGLEVLLEFPGGITFKTAGDTKFMVYAKDNHVAATYTVLNFEVDNVKVAVDALNAKGVEMEKYPEMGTDAQGIASMEGQRMAWFTDPAGDIIGLMGK